MAHHGTHHDTGVAFFATPQTDRFFLQQLVRNEQNSVSKSMLSAHLFFRHSLLTHPLARLQDLLFSNFTPTLDQLWTSHVKEVLTAHGMLPEALQTDHMALHYIQRWVRQLLDPRGIIRVGGMQEGLGLRVIYAGSATTTLHAGQWVLNDNLDGFLIQPTPAIPKDWIPWMMSTFKDHGSPSPGVLVGPLSMVNHDALSSLVLKALTRRQLTLAGEAESTKDRIEDQCWFPGSEHINYVFLMCVLVLNDDGTIRSRRESLVPGSEILMSYNKH